MLPCSQRALILVLEHVGNFGVRLPPGCSHGVKCTLFVCSNFKPLCCEVTSASIMYTANPGGEVMLNVLGCQMTY